MNRDEFGSRVLRCRQKLMAIAGRMLPSGECEDAVQSAVLSAWEHLPQLKDENAFEAWLTQILINQCRQRLRQRKKETDAAAALILRWHEQTEELPLCEALEQMKPDEQILLRMHHEAGYSISEIAAQLHASEDAVKMRLYRARRRLRVILVSLLLLLLLASVAIGTGLLDVQWFLTHRRASPAADTHSDFGSVNSISYNGRYLIAEISDVQWDTQRLEVLIAYSIAGTDENPQTVHNANIGVDGERHDHIWIDDTILPVEEWSDGKQVYTYYLDGWTMEGQFLGGSEDSLSDGKGEAMMSELSLVRIDPQTYARLLAEDGALTLTNRMHVSDYQTGNTIEVGILTARISAPDSDTWRDAYEAFYH